MKRKFKAFTWRVENDPKKREEAIKHDLPVRFEIRTNNNIAKGSKLWDELRTFDSLGKNAVRKYDDIILKYSQRHNIDPDIVRSVMYAENARGHYVVGNKLADVSRVSKSVLQMNIQKDRWASIVEKKT